MRIRFSTLFVFAAAMFAAYFVAPAVAHAQIPSGNGSGMDMADPRRDQRAMMVREQVLRHAPNEANAVKKPDARAVAIMVAQIRDDFTKIQVLRTDLSHTFQAGKPVDYSALANRAKDVNKRARRLQENLVGITPKEDEKAAATKGGEPEKPPTVGRMRADVVVLCNTIDRFVDNPALVATGTVDAEQAAAAVRDLEQIVTLSESLRHGADLLERADANK